MQMRKLGIPGLQNIYTRSFWQIPVPKSCSWSWKKLMHLREGAKKLLSFKVGSGHNISLWFDAWHPDGRLIDIYGFRAVYDSGLSLNACVSIVLHEGSWNWPPARSNDLVAIQVRLPDVKIGEADVAILKSKSGVYSCGETWHFLRPKFLVVPWWKVVWHPMAIPRHAFVLWLVFRQAIATKEKMCGWGFIGHTLCRFCFHVQESIDHFFSNVVSAVIFGETLWRIA
jgi:hypothetical protein